MASAIRRSEVPSAPRSRNTSIARSRISCLRAMPLEYEPWRPMPRARTAPAADGPAGPAASSAGVAGSSAGLEAELAAGFAGSPAGLEAELAAGFAGSSAGSSSVLMAPQYAPSAGDPR